MNRYWLALLSILVLGGVQITSAESLPFSAEQRQYLQQKKVLRYCVDPSWLPFEAIDETGQHIGISADYVKLWQQDLPIPLQLVVTKDWPASLEAIKQQRCDLLTMAMLTPSRRQFLDFSAPYLNIPSVIATTYDKPFIQRLSDVPAKPLGIRAGFGFLEIYQQLYPTMQFIQYDSYEAGLLHVQSGLLYGMLGNMGSLSYLLQQQKMHNLKIAGRIPGDSLMSVATRKDEPELQAIFALVLKKISASEHQQISNHWLTVRMEQGADYKMLAQLAGLMLLLSLIGLFAYRKVRRLNQQLLLANAALAQLSQHDPLTGLFNRQSFDEQLLQTLAICQRQQLPLTLAMLDLDHFKQINDQFGHQFGDYCLKHFARLLQAHFQRSQDILVRYGGEEFILISVGAAAADMQQLLQQFIRELAASPVLHEGVSCQLTVSIGWYCQVPTILESPLQILALADRAMYQVKQTGRNAEQRC